MKDHLMNVHPTANLAEYSHLFEIPDHETREMRRVWQDRKKKPALPKKNKGKGKAIPALTISEAHSSRLAQQ